MNDADRERRTDAVTEIPRTPRFSALLCALFAFVIVPPFLPMSLMGLRLVDVALSALLIVGILSVDRRSLVPVAWALAVPAMALSWAVYVIPNPIVLFLGLIFRTAFLLLLLWVVLADVLGQRTVKRDTIAGAACGYLLLGLLWSGLYTMLELLKPGSISIPAGVSEFGADGTPLTVWSVYFSFVTLTTLGYGDVTPVTIGAGMIASAEAVVGQLYIAVLIARLVGLHALSGE